MKSSEREYYELEENWENFTLTAPMREKIRVLREMIPPGTGRVIDLGCGNGLLTNDLAADYSVTGVDWSVAALGHVRAGRVCASSSDLPLRRRPADLLLCSELLEHLLAGDFEKTIEEINRLEVPSLIISVPHDENIHRNEVRCPSCGLVFNASHHCRSFTAERLASFFPAYALRQTRVAGQAIRDYPLPLLRLRQRLGRRWYQPPRDRAFMCPSCGNRDFPRSRHNPVSLFCDGLNKLISRRRPHWLVALLTRSLGDQPSGACSDAVRGLLSGGAT